jgi:hypothetical protein
MSDLEINIELAKAMGWAELSPFEWIKTSKTGFIVDGIVLCSYQGYGYSKEFDYRDPVIFVAICKRWGLFIRHNVNMAFEEYGTKQYKADSIEKAAALCVIDAVKRGVK